MLHDSQTDMVFISAALKIHFPRLYKSLTDAFWKAHVKYKEIPYKEYHFGERSVQYCLKGSCPKNIIWVRDYMPVTVDKHGSIEQFFTHTNPIGGTFEVCSELKITPFHNDILLDGGNILTNKKGCVYMTDKVFDDNPSIPHDKLIARLKKILNVRTIKIVHWNKSDECGHIDKMMAIADDGSIITDLRWEYLNFLRVENSIFIAQLGEPSDEPALKRIKQAYPQCTIYPIECAHLLAKLGGGLRRATWNTVACGYQNNLVFRTSKRHPFNPFSADAFTEKRLREVLEYENGTPFSNSEWKVFSRAFKTSWYLMTNNLELEHYSDNLFEILVEYMQYWVKCAKTPYFSDIEELRKNCDHLTRYIIDIPYLIVPSWSSYYAQCLPDGPLGTFFIKFEDCEAKITSCIMSKHLYIEDEDALRTMAEKEAKEAEERNDGTVYILNYPSYPARAHADTTGARISHYRYELTACVEEKYHVKLVIYYDTQWRHMTLAWYVLGYLRFKSFFEICTPKPDKDIIIKHKAGVIWNRISEPDDYEMLTRMCENRGITPEQALKWKDYWL